MINYQARNCSLTDIADHMRRDDLVGALARARTAFRGGRINAFDLAEVFFAVANADVNDAINRVRRLGGSSMRRSYVARSSPDVSWSRNSFDATCPQKRDAGVVPPTHTLNHKAILSMECAG
jgi:hypothetical protein